MNVLETERLVLRHLTIDDAQFIFILVNDPSWLRFIGDRGVHSLADARDYISKGPVESYRRHGFGLYLTALKEDATPIGICGLLKRDNLPDADIGFAFLPQFVGRGYAYEAACAVMAHAKIDFGLGRVIAVTNPDNSGSIRVLEKLGLKFERMIRMAADKDEIKVFGCSI
ncbi:MAG: GNAT family N-acetyltransferase [Rudaea sp.]|nr:GNAT family N-acetyltransferase [Rudaea sp.]